MENLQGGTLALEHRYDVLERVDRHGFLTLYHGRQDPFAKPVWVKAYDGLATAGADDELFNRLKEAGQRVSHLTDTGVLRVIDYGELGGGIPFVISERDEGEPLSAVLEREGTLSTVSTADLVARLAGILEGAHRQGIAHGSLSPRWIYVDGPRYGEATVGHFQLAISVSEILAADNAMMSAKAISAFPPEMFEHAEDDESVAFTPAGDIWALGVLAYTALVGVHPFFEDELDASEGILRLRSDPVRPLSELGIAPQLSRVVQRALDKDPDARFPCVAEFAEAFARAASTANARPPADSATPGSTSEDSSPTAPASTATGAEGTSEASAALASDPRSLDNPAQREPGPSDRLLTAALVLLFLSNLAWLFYVTGTSAAEAHSNAAANKSSHNAVVSDESMSDE